MVLRFNEAAAFAAEQPADTGRLLDMSERASMRLRLSPQSNSAVVTVRDVVVGRASMRLRLSPQSNHPDSHRERAESPCFNEAAAFAAEQQLSRLRVSTPSSSLQ